MEMGNKKAIIKKMEQLLSSDDLEMVQLGGSLLQKYKPSRTWKTILSKYSSTKGNDVIWPKYWTYVISERPMTITIYARTNIPNGLWQQLNTGYRHTYTIHTGKGGMELIQKAMKNFKFKSTNEKRKQK